MPLPGEQHRASTTLANPFEEVKPHTNEYTAQEVATLQSRLEKQLGPEYISSRPGAAGQKVHYLAAEKCINLANEVFGFNGWCSGIRDIQVDFVDESQSTGKISLGLSVIVRVTLRDGTYHEDIGYGHIENCKGKAAAFEKAKKEGTTDGLKRALRNFGNILGNCIYDKDYLGKVTKLKIAPSKWDADNLHRHPDYAPVKKEPLTDSDDLMKASTSDSCYSGKEAEDEFGGADFDEVDLSVTTGEHPDEVVLDLPTAFPALMRGASPVKTTSYPSNRTGPNHIIPPLKPPASRTQNFPGIAGIAPQTSMTTNGSDGSYHPLPNRHLSASGTAGILPSHAMTVTGGNSLYVPKLSAGVPNIPPHLQRPPQPPNQQGASNRPPALPAKSLQYVDNQPSCASNNPNHAISNAIAPIATTPSNPPGPPEHEPPIGFFTARAAETVQNGSSAQPNIPFFNPHLESPSIRKTAGIDHTKTKPVGRDAIPGPPTNIGHVMPPIKTNYVNPQTDQVRRIGMPGGGASPLQNRNSYRPPQMMKRPLEHGPATPGRPPLVDVTSASNIIPQDSGGEAKRQRVEGGSEVVVVVPPPR